MLIRLIGHPTVGLSDKVQVPGPRGRKSWALLAYLVGSSVPVPRNRLVSLLFPDAEDGLAALRWNLAELRRLLGPATVAGDPITLALGPGTDVDVLQLATAPWYELVEHVDLEAPLLEGLTVPGCTGFELWLAGERQRVLALQAAALREAARALAAAGRAAEAVRHARRLVTLQPWDESGHELLVRTLAQSGEVTEARAHVELVTEAFLDEMGVGPSRSLRAAAEPRASPAPAASRTRTLAQLHAGRSAVSAGAADAGIESLRNAVQGARALADPELLAQCLVELGSAQVHAVRGADEAGVAALREAVSVADRAGRPELATRACRELAWVEFLRCRAVSSEAWLDRADATGGSDASERAWIQLIRGSLRSDAGRHGEAIALLEEAVELATDAEDRPAAALALTHLGRIRLLRHEDEQAETHLREARRLAEAAGWLAFVPYPEAWLAELALRAGRTDEAAELFSHSHALAIEVGDPCWESLACRGLGLVAVARGDHESGAQLLHDSPVTCRRVTDSYVWLEAYGLAAQVEHALARDLPGANTLLDELDGLVSSHGMRELQAESALLRARAGHAGALAAAAGLVAGIDNPHLAERLSRLGGALPDTPSP